MSVALFDENMLFEMKTCDESANHSKSDASLLDKVTFCSASTLCVHTDNIKSALTVNRASEIVNTHQTLVTLHALVNPMEFWNITLIERDGLL